MGAGVATVLGGLARSGALPDPAKAFAGRFATVPLPASAANATKRPESSGPDRAHTASAERKLVAP